MVISLMVRWNTYNKLNSPIVFNQLYGHIQYDKLSVHAQFKMLNVDTQYDKLNDMVTMLLVSLMVTCNIISLIFTRNWFLFFIFQQAHAIIAESAKRVTTSCITYIMYFFIYVSGNIISLMDTTNKA